MIPQRPPCFWTLIWSLTPPRTCFIASSTHVVHCGPAAVPLATLAEPVTVPVLRSRKAQLKKLGLPGDLIEATLAGVRSVGSGGGACVMTLAVGPCGEEEKKPFAAAARDRLTTEASVVRV